MTKNAVYIVPLNKKDYSFVECWPFGVIFTIFDKINSIWKAVGVIKARPNINKTHVKLVF